MATVSPRGKKFRVQVLCGPQSGSGRLQKTLPTRAEAEAWGAAMEAAKLANGGRLAPPPATPATVQHPIGRGFPGLLSHAAIVAAARPVQRTCGVYFLCRAGTVVYVGQSIHIEARLPAHRQIAHDAVHVIPCEPHQLKVMESRYILALQPVENRSRDGRLLLSVPRAAFAA